MSISTPFKWQFEKSSVIALKNVFGPIQGSSIVEFGFKDSLNNPIINLARIADVKTCPKFSSCLGLLVLVSKSFEKNNSNCSSKVCATSSSSLYGSQTGLSIFKTFIFYLFLNYFQSCQG